MLANYFTDSYYHQHIIFTPPPRYRLNQSTICFSKHSRQEKNVHKQKLFLFTCCTDIWKYLLQTGKQAEYLYSKNTEDISFSHVVYIISYCILGLLFDGCLLVFTQVLSTTFYNDDVAFSFICLQTPKIFTTGTISSSVCHLSYI